MSDKNEVKDVKDSKNERPSNGNQSRGRRHSNKANRRNSRDEKVVKSYAASNNCNDPNWYIPSDQVLSDVASISYNNPLGIKTGNAGAYNMYYGNIAPDSTAGDRVPGVASIELLPTVGYTADETSAVNIAAMNLYSAIRRSNSGAKNYDAPDLMETILAVGSAYSAISWLMRIYGYANVYSSMNRYIPKCLIESNHVNFESVLNNLSDFRARINLLVLQLNAIYVPKGLPIFDRWFHMYEKCFADSATPQAQIYQYVPAGFYLRDDTTGDLQIMNLPYHSTGKLMTYVEITDYVANLINALLYSEDVGTMSGDVLKAFGEGGIYTAPMVPDGYAVVPDLSDEIRSQFENAVILGIDYTRSSLKITQDASKAYLKSAYQLSVYKQVGGDARGKFINFHKTDITPGDTMVATRLATCYTCSRNANEEWDVNLLAFGSEIAANCIISTYVSTNNGAQKVVHVPVFTFSNVAEGAHTNASFAAITALQKVQIAAAFDWFPELRINVQSDDVVQDVSPVGYLNYMGSVWDYDRGTFIDEYRLGLMHTTALFGEFGVPR